jgi:hypothetical protein
MTAVTWVSTSQPSPALPGVFPLKPFCRGFRFNALVAWSVSWHSKCQLPDPPTHPRRRRPPHDGGLVRWYNRCQVLHPSISSVPLSSASRPPPRSLTPQVQAPRPHPRTPRSHPRRCLAPHCVGHKCGHEHNHDADAPKEPPERVLVQDRRCRPPRFRTPALLVWSPGCLASNLGGFFFLPQCHASSSGELQILWVMLTFCK